jgi:hypothetical protein
MHGRTVPVARCLRAQSHYLFTRRYAADKIESQTPEQSGIVGDCRRSDPLTLPVLIEQAVNPFGYGRRFLGWDRLRSADDARIAQEYGPESDNHREFCRMDPWSHGVLRQASGTGTLIPLSEVISSEKRLQHFFPEIVRRH